MLTLQQAIDLCILRIISPNLGCHPNYDRVVKWAKLYEQLITGEEQEELVKKYFSHESKEEIEKIINITQPITSSVCNALITAFKKVLRTQPIVKKIDFEEFTEEKKELLQKAIDNYFGGKPLDNYIEKRIHDLSFLDPNTFIVTEFEPLLNLKEKARPFPFEVNSSEAVNFSLKNGILQFLLVEHQIAFTTATEKKKGVNLIMYLNDNAITFSEVPKVSTATVDEKKGYSLVSAPVDIELRNSVTGNFETITQLMPVEMITKDRQFNIQYFTHKQGRVPAERIGYVPDKKTNGVTFVNPFHYGALPYLMKSIKTVAELDLTMHAHTFPQKLVYVDACKLDMNSVCSTSKQRIDQCTMCGSKGYLAHKSSKDVVSFPLPRDKDEMIDLNNLIAYVYPPIEGIKFQDEYVNSLVVKCYKGVFNSEVFSKDEVAATATGKNIDLQNVYDTLFDYASKIADYWENTVRMIGVILDYPDTIAELKYPQDFKLKSVSDLLADLTTANTGSAPSFIINEINRDIANQLYQDRPMEMKKYEVKQRLAPFTGKSVSDVSMIMTADDVLKVDKITYNYFEQFMEELEEDSLKSETGFDLLLTDVKLKAQLKQANSKGLIWFYDLPFNIQKALLLGKANEKAFAIDAETPDASAFGTTGTGNVDIGKLPLALQQLGLARQRAIDVGDATRAEALGKAMDALIAKVSV